MSKAHRGRPLKMETPGSGRGTCPVCKRSGIKLLYENEVDEKKLVVCKQCHTAVRAGKYKDVIAAL